MNYKWLLPIFLLALITFPLVRADEEVDADVEAPEEPEKPKDLDAMSIEGLTEDEAKDLRSKMQTKKIGAQTDRMMKLIIHSLYKNKEIFLRELISNASDALDKIRLLSLTDSSQLDSNDELVIKVRADSDNNVLHITDSGIGMTSKHLETYLGTIAKSGTADLFEKIEQDQGATAVSDLIGQFGVGFYSAFLVADRVLVTSKHNDDEQYMWESDAGDTFKIIKDPRGNTLKRGTTISLYLKEESQEYLQPGTLKTLINKYSQFINFPIMVWEEETKEVEVPLTDEEIAEEEAKEAEKTEDEEEVKDDDDDADIEDAEDDDKDKPKTKKVQQKVADYKLQNSVKPIWTRAKSEVSDEDYNAFYKAISKDSEPPVARVHFSAEGEIGFKSILYVPKTANSDLYNDYGSKKSKSVKLYVRRVFITDDFSDMMPKYLSWLVGIVDSDDLPLNVSREQLQQNKLLKVIKKKMVRKALDMIKSMKDEDYKAFYEHFGTAMKLGVIEDSTNRNRLAKLIRFASSNDEKELTSLEDYVERMKEKQDKIFVVSGNGLEQTKASPFAERLLAKGFEVLYLTEPVDEYVIQSLPEFDGKRFQDAAKEGLELDTSEKAKESQKELESSFEPLVKWLKEKALKDKISDAAVSSRLTNTPAALVASAYGWSGNMQRVMQAQAYKSRADSNNNYYAKQKKKLEVNPRHPLIKSLNDMIQDDEDSEVALNNAALMFDTAVLTSNYDLADKAEFASRILKIMYANLGIDKNAKPEEEVFEEEDDEEVDDAEEVDAEDDEDADADEFVEGPDDGKAPEDHDTFKSEEIEVPSKEEL